MNQAGTGAAGQKWRHLGYILKIEWLGLLIYWMWEVRETVENTKIFGDDVSY